MGLARLGKDAEVRQTQTDSVCNLSLAFSYGRKGADGKRPTEWVDATLWGKRAEALAPYLLKGGLVFVTLDEVHNESFTKRDGTTAVKLVGKVADIELASSGTGQQAARPATPTPPSRPAPAPRQAGGSGFDDMDDDIPFNDPLKSRAFCLAI